MCNLPFGTRRQCGKNVFLKEGGGTDVPHKPIFYQGRKGGIKEPKTRESVAAWNVVHNPVRHAAESVGKREARANELLLNNKVYDHKLSAETKLAMNVSRAFMKDENLRGILKNHPFDSFTTRINLYATKEDVVK